MSHLSKVSELVNGTDSTNQVCSVRKPVLLTPHATLQPTEFGTMVTNR